MAKLLNLEHELLGWWRRQPKPNRAWILLISGGRDSIALLESHARIARVLRVPISVVHVNHGAHVDSNQVQFRKQARELVENNCQKLGLEFYTNAESPQIPLQSENQMRIFRNQVVERWLNQWNSQARVVTGHHRGDELENILIRLIRGSGKQGLVSFRNSQSRVARPLLWVPESELLAYAKMRRLIYVEDPSNEKTQYLRNWIRNEWLPALEMRNPGAKNRLYCSLQNVLREPVTEFSNILGNDGRINLQQFLAMNRDDKRGFLAWYMLKSNLRAYTSSHVNEVMKNIDRSLKRHSFQLLGRKWSVDESSIWLDPSEGQ